jgi:hypothetical protein
MLMMCVSVCCKKKVNKGMLQRQRCNVFFTKRIVKEAFNQFLEIEARNLYNLILAKDLFPY